MVAAVAPVTRKSKAKVPAPDNWKDSPQKEKNQHFWNFVLEAVRGVTSEEPLCREVEFGGLSAFLPDVMQVAKWILVPYRDQLLEQLWRCMVIVWLGVGGPGFASYKYVTAQGTLLGKSCPSDAMLPPADAALGTANLEPMYAHLASIARANKPTTVLSGDGRQSKCRFAEVQGLPVLEAFRDAVCDLARLATDGGEPLPAGLERLGPKGIYNQLKQYKMLGNLAIKEFYCYMTIALPSAFDTDRFVPFGGGAKHGIELLQGEGVKVDDGTWALLQHLKADTETAALIERAAMARRGALPKPVRALPGYDAKRMRPGTLDVEVCACWFQGYLRAKEGNVPKNWKAFRREFWDDISE